MTDRDERQTDDRGFTLLEILIVVTIIGLVVTAIATTFIVIVRVTPDTDVRIDDARSTRGMATFLSHDTTSAPPYQNEMDGAGVPQTEGGVIVDTSLANPDNDDCGVGGADNRNSLHLQWRENATTDRTFVANYRWVVQNGEGSVRRYTCSKVGAGAFGAPTSVRLVSGLSPTVPPIVNLLIDASGEAYSVEFILTAPSGAQVTVETGSRNPVEFY